MNYQRWKQWDQWEKYLRKNYHWTSFLTCSIKRLLKFPDKSSFLSRLEALNLFHVHFFLDQAVKKGGQNVKLSYFELLSSRFRHEKSKRIHFAYQSRGLIKINSWFLIISQSHPSWVVFDDLNSLIPLLTETSHSPNDMSACWPRDKYADFVSLKWFKFWFHSLKPLFLVFWPHGLCENCFIFWVNRRGTVHKIS